MATKVRYANAEHSARVLERMGFTGTTHAAAKAIEAANQVPEDVRVPDDAGDDISAQIHKMHTRETARHLKAGYDGAPLAANIDTCLRMYPGPSIITGWHQHERARVAGELKSPEVVRDSALTVEHAFF